MLSSRATTGNRSWHGENVMGGFSLELSILGPEGIHEMTKGKRHEAVEPSETSAKAILPDHRRSDRRRVRRMACAGRRATQELQPAGDFRRSRRAGLEGASDDHRRP